MKPVLRCLLLFLYLSCSSQTHGDSTLKPGFYSSLEVCSPWHYDEKSGYKYFDESRYTIQWRPYNIRTPNLGIGYMIRWRRLFCAMELSYWYGVKDAKMYAYRSSATIDGPSNYNTDMPPAAGEYYYIYQENASGSAHLQNLDIQLHLGAAVGKRLSVYAGFRRNFLVYYSYSGKLDRFGHKYYSYGNYAPSLQVEPAYAILNAKEMKKVKFQELHGIFFLNAGLNYLFAIGKRPCFVELNFDMPVANNYYSNKMYMDLKFGFSLSRSK